VNNLLNDTGRVWKGVSGDGHNNCGFNAVLVQTEDGHMEDCHLREKLNSLRSNLGYGNESSNQMFDTSSCPLVAALFHRPVVEVIHGCDGRVKQLYFSTPGGSVHLAGDEILSQNFVGWCANREWPQDEIDNLLRWFQDNLSYSQESFGETTILEVALFLLRQPESIVLISTENGGHFDAAPFRS
jgi:hypothetical protein